MVLLRTLDAMSASIRTFVVFALGWACIGITSEPLIIGLPCLLLLGISELRRMHDIQPLLQMLCCQSMTLFLIEWSSMHWSTLLNPYIYQPFTDNMVMSVMAVVIMPLVILVLCIQGIRWSFRSAQQFSAT